MRVIYGCARLMRLPGARQTSLLAAVSGLGIVEFDVARAYGAGLAERALASRLVPRPGLRVTTKVGLSFFHAPFPGRGGYALARLRAWLSRRAGVREYRPALSDPDLDAAWLASTAQLRPHRIDTLLLHDVEATDPGLPGAIRHLLTAKHRGWVRHVGVSTGYEQAVAVYGRYGEALDVYQHDASGALRAGATARFPGVERRVFGLATTCQTLPQDRWSAEVSAIAARLEAHAVVISGSTPARVTTFLAAVTAHDP